ncbi:MAG: BolA family protein [Candidatus Methylopumilus sp.]|jgi:BolA protein
MNLIEEINTRLQHLKPIELDIQDDSALHAGHKGNGGGGHFTIRIVSADFNGKSQVARHRAIYQLMGELMPKQVHALSIHAIASNE